MAHYANIIPPSPDMCFPTGNFSDYIFLMNPYQRAFGAKFLITYWWNEAFPNLTIVLYVLAGVQLGLSVVGVIIAAGRTVSKKKYKDTYLFYYASHKLLPFFTSQWNLALSGMIMFLPTQWLSNITMGFILFHAWPEFFSMVMRFLMLREKRYVTPLRFLRYVGWMVFVMIATGVPFLVISNPVAQGRITALIVLPADFLNLFLAPYLAYKAIKENPEATAIDKAHEILSGLLFVLHVVWFYGQGIFACVVSVQAGARFFIAFQIINFIVYLGIIATNLMLIRKYNEWRHPLREFANIVFVLNPYAYVYARHDDDDMHRHDDDDMHRHDDLLVADEEHDS